MAHVAQYKKDVVKRMIELINQYPIAAVLDMENLPAAQLQVMKDKLRKNVEIFMTKKRLMKIAFTEAGKNKKGVDKLVEHFRGMPALIFTKDNPFSLFKTIKKNKSAAYARAGQTAPRDITIKAGPTPFAPGPVISELGALKLKTKVENGKVVIVNDGVVCQEGKQIDNKLASMLQRLDIKPMEIGLNIVAVYENGEILTRNVLDIDETKFMMDLENAARWAFNLSVEIGYPTKDNITTLISKAFRESKAIAIESCFMADIVKGEILAKAEAQANALKQEANIIIPENKAEEPAQKEAEKKAETAPTAEEKVKEEKAREEAQIKQEQMKREAEAREQKAKEEKANKEKAEEVEAEARKAAETDKNAAKMAEATKKHAEASGKKAEEILKEVEKEMKHAPKPEEKSKKEDEKKKIEILAHELVKKGTLRS